MRSIQRAKRGPKIIVNAMLPGLGTKPAKVKVAKFVIYGTEKSATYLILAGGLVILARESADEVEQLLQAAPGTPASRPVA